MYICPSVDLSGVLVRLNASCLCIYLLISLLTLNADNSNYQHSVDGTITAYRAGMKALRELPVASGQRKATKTRAHDTKQHLCFRTEGVEMGVYPF